MYNKIPASALGNIGADYGDSPSVRQSMEQAMQQLSGAVRANPAQGQKPTYAMPKRPQDRQVRDLMYRGAMPQGSFGPQAGAQIRRPNPRLLDNRAQAVAKKPSASRVGNAAGSFWQAMGATKNPRAAAPVAANPQRNEEMANAALALINGSNPRFK